MNSLVSPSWLAARLGKPDVAVLDASMPLVGVQPVVNVKARYRQAHIPGAVFFDIEALSEHGTTLPHMLPSADSFGESMSALGLTDTMTLVVYEQGTVFSAPRAWWMLRTMGAKKVYVLDGGLEAWRGAGYDTETGVPIRPRAAFQATQQTDAVRTLAEIRAILSRQGGSEQVIDARSAGRFAGSAPEPRPGLRSGHMPGSLNVPYTELVRDGRLKPAEELREVFARHGVDLSAPITTSCGSGVTAAVLALGLVSCEARDVRLYDGSWSEYAREPGAVILQGI